MGRGYQGDLCGKFWVTMMHSNVASVFGDYGEDMFYCEEREEETLASEIENLTQKEKDSLCSEPSYIHYEYYYHINNGTEDTNFDIGVLQDKIKETQELVRKYSTFMQVRLEEIKSKEKEDELFGRRLDKILTAEQYTQRLEILSKLIEARRLREATADRYEEMLFYLADFLSSKNGIRDIQPITEVAMGGRILSRLLESGECIFEAEI